ncbi:hypothetical protein ABZS68_38675 [Streptomyces sp. NPDC005571]|uniref:hypothetical protein n=1 Tax=Streptomyces sp. NPDC005571 TaxID=3156888 RepID=UPI0033AB8AEA
MSTTRQRQRQGHRTCATFPSWNAAGGRTRWAQARVAKARLLAEVQPREVYRAALTVMMRLVFLLYVEEQRLLPIESERTGMHPPRPLKL